MNDLFMPVALFMNLDAMMMSSRIEQVADDITSAFHTAEQQGSLLVRRAFCDYDSNWNNDPSARILLRPLLVKYAIQMEQVPCPDNPCETLRMRMALEATMNAWQITSLRTFVLAGLNPADAPLVSKLREMGRRVIVLGTHSELFKTPSKDIPPGCPHETPLCLEKTVLFPAKSDDTAYRTYIESRLKCPLPPLSMRQNIYAVTCEELLPSSGRSLPIPLLVLSRSVTKRISGSEQRTVFKLLFTLVIGNAMRAQRNERPHAILIEGAALPAAEWDAVFLRICVSILQQSMPSMPIFPTAIEKVFGVSAEQIVQWFDNQESHK